MGCSSSLVHPEINDESMVIAYQINKITHSYHTLISSVILSQHVAIYNIDEPLKTQLLKKLKNNTYLNHGITSVIIWIL